ncbi:MAG: helix-turn-helix domain-containing protein [Planctomycetes bacterium]|jgi:AraC-like DNA-binding protein|nr:helix-turn-helix domain-containing protein [Planctomycetota bacterium]
MEYFGDLQLISGNHLPRCSTTIERSMAYYALNFAHSGTLRWTTETGRTHELLPPVAYWTWPGPTFRYGCRPDEHWDQYFITFRGSRADRMLGSGFLPTRAQPWQQVSDGVGFAKDFERLLAMVADAPPPPRAVHLLEDLLLRLHESPVEMNGTQRDAFDELADQIRRKPERPWNAPALCRRMGLSEVQFRRRFKAQLGLPPTAFIIQCRMHRAADLLTSTKLTAQAVGREVGCEDPYHFNKQFKRCFGLAPGAYRDEMRTLK